MENVVSIRYRGDARAAAGQLHEAFSEPEAFQLDAPTSVEVRPGAPLGVGTVILTFLFVEGARHVLKRALECLEKYFLESWPRSPPGERRQIEVCVENSREKTCKRLVVRVVDDASAASRVVAEVRALIV